MCEFDRKKENKQKEHNYLIDCFRILALLMVLTVHVSGYLQGMPQIVKRLFAMGAYGVALYFIISGFLSYPSVMKSNSFVKYSKKKMIRILPMYYISLFFTFVLGGLILKEYPITWQWIYSVFFLNMFIPGKDWMWWNSVNYFWTMPAFIAWYVVSYPLLLRVNNMKKAALIILITSIIVSPLKYMMKFWASDEFINWNFFCLIYVFCFGVLAYFVIREKKYFGGVLIGIGIGVIGIIAGNRSGFFIFGLIFYFLIISTSMIPTKWVNRKMRSVVKLLSAITYSTYLTHWFILKLVGNMLSQLPWIIAYVVFIVSAGLLGYICYRFIEKPCSRYKEY